MLFRSLYSEVNPIPRDFSWRPLSFSKEKALGIILFHSFTHIYLQQKVLSFSVLGEIN